jgi:hypothetical protein
MNKGTSNSRAGFGVLSLRTVHRTRSFALLSIGTTPLHGLTVSFVPRSDRAPEKHRWYFLFGLASLAPLETSPSRRPSAQYVFKDHGHAKSRHPGENRGPGKLYLSIFAGFRLEPAPEGLNPGPEWLNMHFFVCCMTITNGFVR